jgi:hypothetical protein
MSLSYIMSLPGLAMTKRGLSLLGIHFFICHCGAFTSLLVFARRERGRDDAVRRRRGNLKHYISLISYALDRYAPLHIGSRDYNLFLVAPSIDTEQYDILSLLYIAHVFNTRNCFLNLIIPVVRVIL